MRSALVALAIFLATLLGVSPAPVRAGFDTGVAGYEFDSANAEDRDRGAREARAARASIVRLNVGWSAIAKSRPADAADPADPAYSFSQLDAAVRSAVDQGLKPLITVQSAPAYAEGANRPQSAPPGSWKPSGGELEKFARALARRYSGSFEGLPRVRHYQAWNEPNLDLYISPQYESDELVSPEIYRQLLNGFFDGINAVDSANVVVTGGTAPYGNPPGGTRTRPLTFIRDLLCVTKGGKSTNCPVEPKFDVLAHHPINTSGGPTTSAIDPDDASTPDFKFVRKIVEQAERRGTIATRGEHALWATELWWESNPPDAERGLSLATQARYLEEALYILWKQGAELVINLQIRDPAPSTAVDSLDAGLYFSDGRKKPAFTAFRFPFVTERSGAGRLRAWGRSPVRGSLAIQAQKRKGWRTVKKLKVKPGKVFTARLAFRGKGRLRAVVAGEKSLSWRQR